MYLPPNQQPLSGPPPWWQFRYRRLYYQQRFKALPRKRQLLLGCGSLAVIFFLCAICGTISNIAGGGQAQSIDAQASPTAVHTTPKPVYWQTAVAQTKATQTVQARITPTPKPVPTPTPTVAPAPQPTSAPAQLTVTIILAQATDYSDGEVSVQTSPGAALTISIVYCSGKPAKSASLQGVEYADSGGVYIWGWTPDTTCRGQASATVTASLNGQTASASTSFSVN